MHLLERYEDKDVAKTALEKMKNHLSYLSEELIAQLIRRQSSDEHE